MPALRRRILPRLPSPARNFRAVMGGFNSGREATQGRFKRGMEGAQNVAATAREKIADAHARVAEHVGESQTGQLFQKAGEAVRELHGLAAERAESAPRQGVLERATANANRVGENYRRGTDWADRQSEAVRGAGQSALETASRTAERLKKPFRR